MRSFSKEEKIYLKRVTELCKSKDWQNLKFGVVIYKIFERTFSFDSPKTFELKDNESGIESDGDEYSKAITDGYMPISIFCSLISYLEQNQLVFFIPLFETKDFDSIGFGIYKGKGYFQLTDHTLIEFIRLNYHNVVYPSQELFDLVDNDFKTIEQLQFEQEIEQANVHHEKAMESAKKQVKIAWLAFGVALVTLLITLGFNIYESVKVKSNTIEKQLNQIIIQQKLPTVSMTKITNDTLNGKVLKSLKKQQNGKNEHPY